MKKLEILPKISEDFEINFKYDLTKWLDEQKNVVRKRKEILLFYKDVMRHRR